MASLIASIGAIGAGGIGQQQALKSTVEGIKTQAEIESLGRGASEREFRAQQARQQPFVQAGQRAIPDIQRAISNRLDVSDLPATQIQAEMIQEQLGGAPQFVVDRAMRNLNAIEAERQKGRLSDLINVGLGGTASSAQSGVNLGTTLGQSFANQGALDASALQTAAMGRQNIANQLGTQLAGLPAFFASQPRQQQPLTTIGTTFNPQTLRR